MRLCWSPITGSVAALAVVLLGISCAGAPPSPKGFSPPAVASVPPAVTAAASRIALTHITVIDVVNGTEQPDRSIVIDGDRIVAIVAGPPPAAPPTRVVEMRGKYAIPGLWDMHVHCGDPAHGQLFVANGVTGVRVMCGNCFPQDLQHFHFEMRDAFDKKVEVGPRMIIGSRVFDGPTPYAAHFVSLSDADEGRKAVADAQKSGVDFIKVYSNLPRNIFFAIADESKKRGLPFAGHVPEVPEIVSVAEASDAGQKSIEHSWAMLISCSSRETELRTKRAEFEKQGRYPSEGLKFLRSQFADAMASYDTAHANALFAKLVANDTWHCPTFVALRAALSFGDPSLANDSRMQYVTEPVKTMWKNRALQEYSFLPTQFDKNLALVGEMNQAGAGLLAGTDQGEPYCFAGVSLHDELRWLVEAGLTSVAALRAATLGPARFLGREATMGTVAEGKVADRVVLEANPLVDIANSRKIADVVSRGTLHERNALDKMLEEVKNAVKDAAAHPRWGEGLAATPAVGSVFTGDITLITADRHDLDCAAKAGVRGFQCGFVSESSPRPIDELHKLRPFMTLDRQLFLIPGLFSEPTIDARYKAELPTKPRDELSRFTAKCQLKVIGELADVRLRWTPDGERNLPKNVVVATVSDCRLSLRRL